METCHGHGGYGTWTKDIHFFVEAVIDYEIVCHTDTVGFHGMALAVVVVAYFGVVEVGDATAASATAADDAATTTSASASANTAASARGGGDAGERRTLVASPRWTCWWCWEAAARRGWWQWQRQRRRAMSRRRTWSLYRDDEDDGGGINGEAQGNANRGTQSYYASNRTILLLRRSAVAISLSLASNGGKSKRVAQQKQGVSANCRDGALAPARSSQRFGKILNNF